MILKDYYLWPAWFIQLEFQLNYKGIWHLVDPELLNTSYISNNPLSALPMFVQMIAEQDEKNQQEYIARIRQQESSELTIAQKSLQLILLAPITFDDIKELYNTCLKKYLVASMLQTT